MPVELWDHELQWLQWGIVIVATMIAATIDVRTHRIPNLLTGPLLLAGFIWAGAVAGWGGLVDALVGMVVVGLPFFIMWLMRAGGAGDAKMMMALGAWLGVINGAAALLGVAVAGGFVAIVYMLVRKRSRSTLGNLLLMLLSGVFLVRGAGEFTARRELMPSFQGPRAIPYGVAICLGTCVAAATTMIWRTT